MTGDEIAMYQVKVRIASKVRKNDLPVISGDTVSIIRTTNCPKGKWLARDDNHKCKLTCIVLLVKTTYSYYVVLLFLWGESCQHGQCFSADCPLLVVLDGYISVTNVELNIREMMELGKKAQAAGRGGTLEGDTISIGSRWERADTIPPVVRRHP